ncbi:hypothetical protein A2U01_0116180, partial [Trifolium medium]|nr:hypothetical protein [Trifolium medium]
MRIPHMQLPLTDWRCPTNISRLPTT